MHFRPKTIPMPFDQCPGADDPEAILSWLHWQHLRSGRIEQRHEHHDPFWQRIEEKQRDRLRYAEELEAVEDWEQQVQRVAALFDLCLNDLDKHAQIEAVTSALVPMRFHVSGALEEFGQRERAAEVRATRW